MNDTPTPNPNGATRTLRILMGGASFAVGLGLIVADLTGMLAKEPNWKLPASLIIGGLLAPDFTWDKLNIAMQALKLWRQPDDR